VNFLMLVPPDGYFSSRMEALGMTREELEAMESGRIVPQDRLGELVDAAFLRLAHLPVEGNC
jgi:hypothetical protein